MADPAQAAGTPAPAAAPATAPAPAAATAKDGRLAKAAPPSSAPSAECLQHVQGVWDRIKGNSPIYDIFFSGVRLVSASADGRVLAHLDLIPVHLNSKKIVHGAVSAALVDWAGGMAIAAAGADKTGVSTDIHVSYVSTAREGDALEIEAWVSRVGKTLGFTIVEIRKRAAEDGVKGAVVAHGTHTKYLNFN